MKPSAEKHLSILENQYAWLEQEYAAQRTTMEALREALREANNVIQLMHDSMTMPERDFYDKWATTHGKHFNMEVSYKRSLTGKYLEKQQANAVKEKP